jgi:hypothetical protein
LIKVFYLIFSNLFEVLYSIAGKPVPFLILSFVCLMDAFAVFWVIQPKAVSRVQRDEHGERLQGTPM